MNLIYVSLSFQILFKKRLSNKQWFSLFLVTVGCMVQKLDFNSLPQFTDITNQDMDLLKVSWAFILILVQARWSSTSLVGPILDT